jgi:pantetheine-phosphate adenylyltransferase
VKRRAIYPGSFDPPTYGHIDIIRRSLQMVDEVVVAVVYNPQKDNFLFTPEERIEMFKEELTEVGDRVLYDHFYGLLVDYVEKKEATIIIRGLRAVSDFDYEFQMAGMNYRMAPDIETVFLMASERHQFIASRLGKEVAMLGGDITSFVPPLTLERVLQRIRDRT